MKIIRVHQKKSDDYNTVYVRLVNRMTLVDPSSVMWH